MPRRREILRTAGASTVVGVFTLGVPTVAGESVKTDTFDTVEYDFLTAGAGADLQDVPEVRTSVVWEASTFSFDPYFEVVDSPRFDEIDGYQMDVFASWNDSESGTADVSIRLYQRIDGEYKVIAEENSGSEIPGDETSNSVQFSRRDTGEATDESSGEP